MIHLTYSAHDASQSTKRRDTSYLQYLENQREELKKAVLQAPCYRLDNLASFVETHGERLAHFLEALISYRKRARKTRLKTFAAGLVISLLFGAAGFVLSLISPPLAGTEKRSIPINSSLGRVRLLTKMMRLPSGDQMGIT